MAFCTNCGASVAGTFCSQCGTPARAAAVQAAPVPPAPGAGVPQPVPGTVPVTRKTSPLVWVLVAVLGLFVLGFIGIVGTGLFVVHKARQAGLDSDLIQRNPGYAAAKMIVALNPDVSEVSHDDNAGTITVRDRNTGKEMTWSFDDIKNGKFKFTAQDERGKTATVEIGGSTSKLPSWVPSYPGAEGQGTFSVRGDAGDGSGEGGNYTFTTHDSPSKAMQFYQDKTRDLGMKVKLTSNTPQGGMIVAGDEDERRTLTVVIGEGSGETTVNLTYMQKK